MRRCRRTATPLSPDLRLVAVAGPELTDPRAPRVREARRLTRRGQRAEQRRFLAAGAPAVAEALAGWAARHAGLPAEGAGRFVGEKA